VRPWSSCGKGHEQASTKRVHLPMPHGIPQVGDRSMRALVLSLIVMPCSFACISAAVPPEPKYKLVPQAPPATAVNSVAVSPDGSLIASAAGEGGVRLYDAKTGNLLRALGDIGDRCVVFSPNGQTLTAAGFHMDKLVALWDV